MFSSEKVGGWVQEALLDAREKGLIDKKTKIDFEKAQLTFLGSFSHPVGIRIKNLNFNLEKKCSVVSGKFGTFVLPFNLTKAFRKEIELGLIRLSDGSFSRDSTCRQETAQSVQNKNGDEVEAVKEGFEDSTKEAKEMSFIKALKKISDLDLAFSKDANGELRFKGVLVYDLSIKVDEEKELVVKRFKSLLGSGDVQAYGEWAAKIIFAEGITDFTGKIELYEDFVTSNFSLKEKEGAVKLTSKIFRDRSDSEKNFATVNVFVEDLPLSLIARLKEMNLAGLNLRKTWLDIESDIGVSNSGIKINVGTFKSHGDFGDLNLGLQGFGLEWSHATSSWKQLEDIELKLSEISISDIISINPKKRASGIFGDFGKFNAVLQFKDLTSLSGEFETTDFSLLFRSMGKAAYQKAKSARGRLDYTAGDKLSFVLEEVDLVDGDFEGFVRLDYSYVEKSIYTKFDISHFRLNPDILKGLFKIKTNDGVSIVGDGQALKAAFTKEKDENVPRGNLQFAIQSKGVDFSKWAMEDVRANCGLDETELTCSLEMETLSFEPGFAKAEELDVHSYTKLKSKSFSYKNKKLLFDLKDAGQQDLFFKWTKLKGPVFFPNGYDGKAVKLRDLD